MSNIQKIGFTVSSTVHLTLRVHDCVHSQVCVYLHFDLKGSKNVG